MLQKELNTKREGPPRGTAEGSHGPQARLKEPKMRIFIYPQRSVIGFFTWVPGRPLSLVTQTSFSPARGLVSCSCPQGIPQCIPLAPAASVTTIQPPWYQITVRLSLPYPMHSVPIKKNQNSCVSNPPNSFSGRIYPQVML